METVNKPRPEGCFPVAIGIAVSIVCLILGVIGADLAAGLTAQSVDGIWPETAALYSLCVVFAVTLVVSPLAGILAAWLVRKMR
jgi:hypothetical protein